MSEQPISEGSHWSYPATPGSGFVWFGLYTATQADIDALHEMMGGEVGTQARSLFGRYHPLWLSDWYAGVSPINRPGGIGSPTYEQQWCGTGVKFTKDPIWHINKEKMMVCEVPANCGSYHAVYDGDGWVNYAGPEPGSQAAEILGTTAYHFDDDLFWYYAGPDKPVPWWREGESAPISHDCPLCGHSL